MSVLSLAKKSIERLRERPRQFKYPGVRTAVDGNTAVILCEREASDGAGAYPITPSTQMGEGWAEAAAAGHLNISGRPLLFIEPEGEHAAAAVTAGLAMTGLRAVNFSSGQGIAYMHESLYAAVGKRLTYVLNVGARAMTKSTLNVHAGHDDYHSVDDTGFFQLFAKNVQAAADLNLVAHRIAELALNPGIVAQDGFLTTHLIESMLAPERELIADYLGRPDDLIETPTPAQRILYGETRRRIPVLWDVDNPLMIGLVQNQDAYMQSVAAQRPFFFDHIRELSERAFDEYYELTGRRYARIGTYRAEDADYLVIGQGSVVTSAEAVADYLRETRGLAVGVVDLTMFRPFPSDLLGSVLKGRKGVVVLERTDQPLASDLPLMREIRATVAKCLENGREPKQPSHPELTTYERLTDAPPLYSGSFGLGSRDLQPEGLVGAIENMLPAGRHQKLFYLSIDFVRDKALTPKQESHQQTISDAYPKVKEMVVKGSENPNLMPPGAIAVRLHSIGGWGAITTGKNLAMTLFDLLGYSIKANPKYGSEKKGQPTTYYLSVAPEPIRVNCEYIYVDVVLSPDPNVFNHTNALAGLKEGGVFVLQSDQPTPEKVWEEIPAFFQKIIVDRKIRLFALDAFRIAREEASDPELQLRMQGIAFQGAFFKASPLAEQAGLDEARLLEAIRAQLEQKFGAKGARVVEDNLRVVRRGFDELRQLPDSPYLPITTPRAGARVAGAEPPVPVMVQRLPQSQSTLADVHRFWEQTGNFYARGMGNDNLADPFISLGVMPASTALFRDMTAIRFQHPEWIGENCTACGRCYTVCPDTAIPGLVTEIGALFDTVVRRLRSQGHLVELLPRAVRQLERQLRRAFDGAAESARVADLLATAIDATLAASDLAGDQRTQLASELGLLRGELDGFQVALSRPYFTLPEKRNAGDGGLLSITVNPYTCKGCMECVEVCDDDALRPMVQTEASVAKLRNAWDLWLDLPTTPAKYSRIDDLEQGIGALETLLLDKANYLGFSSGDGACLGCSEKTIVHLFTATVEALMQPRVARQIAKLEDLIARLEHHIQMKLVADLDLSDPAAVERIARASRHTDLTLAGIAGQMEAAGGGSPIDPAWLERTTHLLATLRALREKYLGGTSGNGRARMGMVNSTGCTSVWGSTYPYNPYPFPWTNHLFQDSPSMAMGLFEGHMAKMADGFKAVRIAELELADRYQPERDDELLTYFDWQQFSDEEWELCPPVVSVGGDGAMYDIGFQNLSRLMASGKPIKVLVVDTQVYSNTGGQACTSGFLGQISDMAQYGKNGKGKAEPRKEIGLIGMAHRTTYVLQSTIAHPSHMIEGFIRGLKARRPALFNLYSSCQPEHGIGDDRAAAQAKLAVESRAYPLFRYDPDAGKRPAEAFDLSGNPAPDQVWPTYELSYLSNGQKQTMELPVTFADFAQTEARFRKHFRAAPSDTWNDQMLPLADFLLLGGDERDGKFPFVWSLDRKQQLQRLIVDSTMVASCEERRDFWTLLKALAGIDRQEPSRDEIAAEVRRELVGQLSSNLFRLAAGEASGFGAPVALPAAGAAAPSAASPVTVQAPAGDFLAPWLDSELCTSCDECTRLNPKMFAYNANKQAFIKDPKGGPYSDLVRAAEKCTARVIHPGLPRAAGKENEKWIERARKYN